jgi:hypothetical protein
LAFSAISYNAILSSEATIKPSSSEYYNSFRPTSQIW